LSNLILQFFIAHKLLNIGNFFSEGGGARTAGLWREGEEKQKKES